MPKATGRHITICSPYEQQNYIKRNEKKIYFLDHTVPEARFFKRIVLFSSNILWTLDLF